MHTERDYIKNVGYRIVKDIQLVDSTKKFGSDVLSIDVVTPVGKLLKMKIESKHMKTKHVLKDRF
jgi:hypothetical protein